MLSLKFHENPFSGSRVVSCGQTDRHDEVNSRFSRFFPTGVTVSNFCYSVNHLSYVPFQTWTAFEYEMGETAHDSVVVTPSMVTTLRLKNVNLIELDPDL